MKAVASGMFATVALLAGASVSVADTLESILDGEPLRIAVANEPPYGYVGPEGRITGEAPEIARIVLERMVPSIETEFVVRDFGQLIPGLYADEFDMIAAGMYITPDRCGQVAFSEPTYVIGEAFAVAAGNPHGVHDFDDIADNHEVTVAVMAGAIEYQYAFSVGVPAHRIEIYPDQDQAIEALRRGRVDAVALTALTVEAALAELDDPSIEATEQFYPTDNGEEIRGYGAFAFRLEDERLRDAFNDELSEFIGTSEHLETVRPFGFAESMLPDATAEELCAQ